ncbi:MAG: glycosyltransferase family 39 protein [Anaerolineae bacterium]|nr:glycosyltransferase family 39 protein [Anaerolineae bacterium]
MTFIEENSLSHQTPLLVSAFGLTILLTLFTWLTQGALTNAVTFDEPSHMGAGYAYLQQGLDGLWTVPLRGHPVLFNALEALPLYIAESKIPVTSMPGWGTDRRSYATEFIHAVPQLPGAIFSARYPTILCTIILASVLWRGATDIWGRTAGLLSMLIMFFDPLILAHGRLATNDMAVTAGGSLFLYSIWRWGRKPSWIKTIFLGLLLGFVLLTKATSILYGLVGLGWALWAAVKFKTKYAHLNLQKKFFTRCFVWASLHWALSGLPMDGVLAPPHCRLPCRYLLQNTGMGLFSSSECHKALGFCLGSCKNRSLVVVFSGCHRIKKPLPFAATPGIYCFCLRQMAQENIFQYC